MNEMRRAPSFADARSIKIHNAADFAGMRRAGHLAAETLDYITPYVRPDVHHRRTRPAVPRVHPRPRRDPGAVELPRLPEVDLHLDQPGRLPRHSRRQKIGGRRHRQHRRHRHPRRLARRHQPHVLRRRGQREGAAADRRDLRGDVARHQGGQTGRHRRRHRPRHPELRQAESAFRSFATSAAMASAGCSTTRPTSRTSATPARARCCARACSSPSSR